MMCVTRAEICRPSCRRTATGADARGQVKKWADEGVTDWSASSAARADHTPLRGARVLVCESHLELRRPARELVVLFSCLFV